MLKVRATKILHSMSYGVPAGEGCRILARFGSPNFTQLHSPKPYILIPFFALVLLMGLSNGICLAHPFGHAHDHDAPPTPCELREIHRGEASYLPPMQCQYLDVAFEPYDAPMLLQVHQVDIASILPGAPVEIAIGHPSAVVWSARPPPWIRPSPLIAAHALRGPPVHSA